MELIEEHLCFGGRQLRFRHQSERCQCPMHFSLFLPPQAQDGKVPLLTWLSGLTCNDENFMIKAGAQRPAANMGLAILCPDTSPRGTMVADDSSYALGQGAGFYLNATQTPWKANYQMADYIIEELPTVLKDYDLPIQWKRQGIFGHSMGGHGALTLGIKHSERFKSISAFAPIAAPSKTPWGKTIFEHYLGDNPSQWSHYDATALIQEQGCRLPILIDQGSKDEFLFEQLKPEVLLDACKSQKVSVDYRLQAGYDHSYFFIASFIQDHLMFHQRFLF